MKFSYTKAERRDARMLKQQCALRTAAAIQRTIASCAHDFGRQGKNALCKICGCIRTR